MNGPKLQKLLDNIKPHLTGQSVADAWAITDNSDLITTNDGELLTLLIENPSLMQWDFAATHTAFNIAYAIWWAIRENCMDEVFGTDQWVSDYEKSLNWTEEYA